MKTFFTVLILLSMSSSALAVHRRVFHDGFQRALRTCNGVLNRTLAENSKASLNQLSIDELESLLGTHETMDKFGNSVESGEWTTPAITFDHFEEIKKFDISVEDLKRIYLSLAHHQLLREYLYVFNGEIYFLDTTQILLLTLHYFRDNSSSSIENYIQELVRFSKDIESELQLQRVSMSMQNFMDGDHLRRYIDPEERALIEVQTFIAARTAGVNVTLGYWYDRKIIVTEYSLSLMLYLKKIAKEHNIPFHQILIIFKGGLVLAKYVSLSEGLDHVFKILPQKPN